MMEASARQTRVCAIDVGASGGKVCVADCDGKKLAIQEVYRFENHPVRHEQHLCWDLRYLQQQLERALAAAFDAAGTLEGVAVDTWGFDFVEYGKNGAAQPYPRCYRDAHAKDTMAALRQECEPAVLYAQTGLPPSHCTTLTQMYRIRRAEGMREIRFLLMPDALAHGLGGAPCAESTIASTSQLCAVDGDWSVLATDLAGLAPEALPKWVPSGTITGTLLPRLQRGEAPTRVIAAVGHDTAAAVLALPAEESSFLYLICGTWSLLGITSEKRYFSKEAMRCGLHNQRAADGGNRLQKGVTGLWLCQQLRMEWTKAGQCPDYDTQEALAFAAEPRRSLIDPDWSGFGEPGDIAARMSEYCAVTGQPIPQTKGQQLRCVYESLALQYRKGIRDLEETTEETYDSLYIAGGGAQSQLFMQLIADATNKTVKIGVIDASVLGNALAQLVALGALPDFAAARRLAREQFGSREVQPVDTNQWQQAERNFEKKAQAAAKRLDV